MSMNPLKCLRCDQWFADYAARGKHVTAVHLKVDGTFDPVLRPDTTDVDVVLSMPTDTQDEIRRLERLASMAHAQILIEEGIISRSSHKITAMKAQIENCYRRVDLLKESDATPRS